MFDIGFGELLLVMIIGLIVLGPERLPIAVKTVVRWVRTLRSLAASVQHELSNELQLHELQENLQKLQQTELKDISPELQSSLDHLKEVASAVERTYYNNQHQMVSSVKQEIAEQTPLVNEPIIAHQSSVAPIDNDHIDHPLIDSIERTVEGEDHPGKTKGQTEIMIQAKADQQATRDGNYRL